MELRLIASYLCWFSKIVKRKPSKKECLYKGKTTHMNRCIENFLQ